MNRSNKGFGLTGVFFAVVVLIVSAVLSTTATSAEMLTHKQNSSELTIPGHKHQVTAKTSKA